MFDDFETGHLERKRGDEYCLGRIVDELDSMPQAQRAATTDPGGAAPSMSTIASPLFNANFDEHATVDELRHSYESAISMVTDALGSHASGWTSSEVRIDRGQGLTHLFHGPQADVRVEIYHQLYGPSSSDQLPTVPRSPSSARQLRRREHRLRHD